MVKKACSEGANDTSSFVFYMLFVSCCDFFFGLRESSSSERVFLFPPLLRVVAFWIFFLFRLGGCSFADLIACFVLKSEKNTAQLTHDKKSVKATSPPLSSIKNSFYYSLPRNRKKNAGLGVRM